MKASQMIRALTDNHLTAAAFITGLPDDVFITERNGKWSPGQQLQHLILCLRPISQALTSAAFIEEKFGTIDRPPMDYDQVLKTYQSGLKNGGKAPERFLPGQVSAGRRDELKTELDSLLTTMATQLQGYDEQQLDRLALPHPFLGKLSIRELMYLMSYHPLHHLAQIHHNLESIKSTAE